MQSNSWEHNRMIAVNKSHQIIMIQTDVTSFNTMHAYLTIDGSKNTLELLSKTAQQETVLTMSDFLAAFLNANVSAFFFLTSIIIRRKEEAVGAKMQHPKRIKKKHSHKKFQWTKIQKKLSVFLFFSRLTYIHFLKWHKKKQRWQYSLRT